MAAELGGDLRGVAFETEAQLGCELARERGEVLRLAVQLIDGFEERGVAADEFSREVSLADARHADDGDERAGLGEAA
jgi:hypothetical protein